MASAYTMCAVCINFIATGTSSLIIRTLRTVRVRPRDVYTAELIEQALNFIYVHHFSQLVLWSLLS